MKDYKFYRIYEDLADKIKSGYFASGGGRIPGENELADQYGVSRVTVRRAMEELVSEGLVFRLPKLGTYAGMPVRQTVLKIAVVEPGETANDCKLLDAVFDACARYGMEPTVFNTKNSVSQERRCLKDVEKGRFDGLIFMPTGEKENFDILSRFVIQRFPVVLIDHIMPCLDLPCVKSENTSGFFEAVSYFVKRGKRKIAFFHLSDTMNQNERQRYYGYCKGLVSQRIELDPNYILRLHLKKERVYLTAEEQLRWETEVANAQLKAYLSMTDKPEVICFCNDVSAAAFYKAMQIYDPALTRSVELVGFDDLSISEKYGFSTVRQNFAVIGRKAVSMLKMRIDAPLKRYADVLVNTKLIIREKSAR